MKNTLHILGCAALSFTLVACTTASSPVSPSRVPGSVSQAASLQSEIGGPSSRSLLGGKPAFAAAAKPAALTVVGIVLQDDDEFDVLQEAVIRAGLVDALNGGAQRTVFAPTDAAFVSTLGVVDEAAAIAAVNGLPLDVLTDILLYHVTNGRRNSNSVLSAPWYNMLNGDRLSRDELAAAGIAATDISASNGIVHVINAVLMP